MNDDELELVLTFARQFIGYGNLDAPYWFVGQEEAGVQGEDQAVQRAVVWNNQQFQGHRTVDLVEYSQQVGAGEWFGAHPRLQGTWAPLIKFLLTVAPQLRNNGHGEVNNEEIRAFQRDCWGRADSQTCLLELFGLPKASGGAWPYGDVPQIQTRELGTARTFNQRKLCLRNALECALKHGRLKIVLFYARDDYKTTLWSDICGIDDWNLPPLPNGRLRNLDFLWQRLNGVLFLGVKHPARRHGLMRRLAGEVHRLMQRAAR